MKRVVVCVLLWGGLAGTVYADRHKISKDLVDKLGQRDATVDVVVQFRHDPSDGDFAKFANKGARLKQHLKRFRTTTYAVPAENLDTLSDDPNVSYVSLDRPVHAQFDFAEQTINAPQAWRLGLDGTGVGIAVIDSGIFPHDDLEQTNSHKSRIVYKQIFNSRKGDEYGHGTHVAGIVAGNGKNSSGPGFTTTFKGVAPNAQSHRSRSDGLDRHHDRFARDHGHSPRN